jgi:hypothetical protein
MSNSRARISSARIMEALDGATIVMIGLFWLAGKIRGVVLGPLNIAIGTGTVVSGLLLLLEALGIATEYTRYGLALLTLTLVAGLLTNI